MIRLTQERFGKGVRSSGYGTAYTVSLALGGVLFAADARATVARGEA